MSFYRFGKSRAEAEWILLLDQMASGRPITRRLGTFNEILIFPKISPDVTQLCGNCNSINYQGREKTKNV